MYEKLLSVSEPWLQYAIRVNLLGENKADLVELRAESIQDEKIQVYLHDVTDFHSMLLKNHKNTELPLHKLLFLLDIGLDTDIPEIRIAVEQIMEHKDRHGVYQSMTNIPPHFGGKGEDVFGWCLCDAPLLLLALAQAGVDYQQHIKQGVDHLVGLYREQGFSCAVSEEHGSFRGPGRKDDCCPNATLCMLRLLSEIDEYRKSDVATGAAEALLSLWEHSRERHPYQFYTGTDFRKLKAPAMWYDIVGVTHCLSKFEPVKADPRFSEMIALIKTKQNADGFFTPESVYLKCKGWDFGQKKTASPYLTYLCVQILGRAASD
jgi:hypothetical protein